MKRRELEESIKDDLKKSSLWVNKIEQDCRNQKVFLAIRNNSIDIYYKGGRLFEFDKKKGFKTHIKFAAVITKEKNDYLTEIELANRKFDFGFEKNYERIKENCLNYSGVEDLGISDVYHRHSYLAKDDVIVLDIEITFKSLNEEKNQDRIDLLLFDKRRKKLHFVEAKHYSNSDIWTTGEPKVVKQIKKYEEQIKTKKDDILENYKIYIECLNDIFKPLSPELEPPIGIDEKVILFIFGFDDDQKNKGLMECKEKLKSLGIKNYNIGKPGSDKFKLSTLIDSAE